MKVIEPKLRLFWGLVINFLSDLKKILVKYRTGLHDFRTEFRRFSLGTF